MLEYFVLGLFVLDVLQFTDLWIHTQPEQLDSFSFSLVLVLYLLLHNFDHCLYEQQTLDKEQGTDNNEGDWDDPEVEH